MTDEEKPEQFVFLTKTLLKPGQSEFCAYFYIYNKTLLRSFNWAGGRAWHMYVFAVFWGPTAQLSLDGVQFSWAAVANGDGGRRHPPTAAVHIQHGPRDRQLKQTNQSTESAADRDTGQSQWMRENSEHRALWLAAGHTVSHFIHGPGSVVKFLLQGNLTSDYVLMFSKCIHRNTRR